MDLICYLKNEHQLDIRPARNRRTWMNETPESFAYRCLPLSAANSHGWEIYCPRTFEAEWNGGPNVEDVRVTSESGKDIDGAKVGENCASHFGCGILTFNIGAIIRTVPGYNLWVSGPTNDFKDGIQPLSAVIETDWMPYTFTMNWKFTRPNFKVTFKKGSPFCLIFPVERGLVNRCDPTFRKISEDPDLEKNFKNACMKRGFLGVVKCLKGEKVNFTKEKELVFQEWYMKGLKPDGSACGQNHQKKIRPKPFLPLDDEKDKGYRKR